MKIGISKDTQGEVNFPPHWTKLACFCLSLKCPLLNHALNTWCPACVPIVMLTAPFESGPGW